MFEAVKCDEEGQEEDADEQAGGNRAASAAMPPPLEEEPEVHRRRSRRRRSNNTNSNRERTSSPTEGQTPGLRSRLFGLFGSASRQTNASLEEPLLQSDEAVIAWDQSIKTFKELLTTRNMVWWTEPQYEVYFVM
jgi:hypothetical protein